jgi:hypothetical protein
MGWAPFKNGDPLAAASGKFDVLVTTDQRLSHLLTIARKFPQAVLST